MTDARLPEVARLVEVMATLQQRCPWDREQTHRSLAPYLIEETAEAVEAIETGDRDHLVEELGDVLLQVVFHAEIADDFDLDLVASGVADKLIARHPHVFSDEEAPADLRGVWEERKAVEKGRRSALEGLPEQLSALARAAKIISRVRHRRLPLGLPTEPIDAAGLGTAVLDLAARAQASGVDAEQAVRDAVRALEERVRAIETRAASPG